MNIENMKYVGTAASAFQSSVWPYEINCTESDASYARSDWEFEIEKKIRLNPTCFDRHARVTEFPDFMRKHDLYIKRSQDLGLNMFRISFDWARLCPRPGEFDWELMREYVRIVAKIKLSGQEPMITMHHFTMPLWLCRYKGGSIVHGGWEHTECIRHFRYYIERVAGFLHDPYAITDALAPLGLEREITEKLILDGLFTYVMSVNEPMVTLQMSYLAGAFPPFKRGRVLTTRKILGRMIEAHDIVYSEFKKIRAESNIPAVQVGVGYNWQYFDGWGSSRARWRANEHYAKKIERDGARSDWIGEHYYCRFTCPLFWRKRLGRDYSDKPDFGDIYPEGLYDVLVRMHNVFPHKPIFVSEVGFADRSDWRRPYWIVKTYDSIFKARSAGVPVLGMLLWSLVDNYEWDQAMDVRFGLYPEKALEEPLWTGKAEHRIRSDRVWSSLADLVLKRNQLAQMEYSLCIKEARDQYLEHGGHEFLS
jgi:beta-glucosidase